MNEFISRTLALLEVKDKHRKRITYRVETIAQREAVFDDSGLYNLIIAELEFLNAPYSERFFLRLDAPFQGGDDLLHSVVAMPSSSSSSEEVSEEEFMGLESLPGEYQSLFQELKEVLGEITLDVLVRREIVDPATVRERLQALKERKEKHGYIVPPRRQIKQVYFTEDNAIVFKLGYRQRGYDALALYQQYYEGVTRGRLLRCDSGLYYALVRRGLLDHVPLEVRPSGFDAVREYLEKYPDVTRSALQNLDPGLYNTLRRRGRIDLVPCKGRPKGYDAVGEYLRKYPGIPRTQLARLDSGLYYTLINRGQIGIVPTEKQLREQRALPLPSKYGDNPLRYYQQHFLGVTRADLHRRASHLYNRLRKEGLLSHVPSKHREKGFDAAAEYQQKYLGVTRGELAERDNTLYHALRRKGQLHVVPKKR